MRPLREKDPASHFQETNSILCRCIHQCMIYVTNMHMFISSRAEFFFFFGCVSLVKLGHDEGVDVWVMGTMHELVLTTIHKKKKYSLLSTRVVMSTSAVETGF